LKHSILDKQSQLDHMKQFKLRKNKQRTLHRSIQIEEASKRRSIIGGEHRNPEISAREGTENEQAEDGTVTSNAAESLAIRLAGADERPNRNEKKLNAAKSIELKLLRSELRHLPQYKRFSKVEKVNAMFNNFNADELQNALDYCKRAKDNDKTSSRQSKPLWQDIQPEAAASSRSDNNDNDNEVINLQLNVAKKAGAS